MLDPEYIRSLPDALVELYAQAEADILSDMARRISQYNYWIPAAEHQAKKLEDMGMVREEIVLRLSQVTGQSQKQIKQLMKDSGNTVLKSEDEVYKRAGMSPPPLRASVEVQAVMNASLKKTNGIFKNLTKTTANTSTKQFENALDRAYLQITSGAFDSETAIRFAVKDLARRGVGAITYPTGHVDTIEVAVRRAVITGVNSTGGKIVEARREQMGANLVEVTAHGGARPEHAVWQGGIYWTVEPDPDYPQNFYDACGYGNGAGIYGWNCSHSHHVYFKGMPRAYTQEMLDRMEAKRYEYNGKKLTEAEAQSRQRYHERQIRRWKREQQAMQAAGLSTEEAAAKVAHWQNTQRDFIRQTGLKRQYGREQVAKMGFHLSDRSGGIVSSVSFPKMSDDPIESSRRIDAFLGHFVKRSSKWSGKTIIDDATCMKEGIEGKKVWSCDIILRSGAQLKTGIHEHLHARSGSHYGPNEYLKYVFIEEGSVEFLSQELCKAYGIKYAGSYEEYVNGLRKIHSILGEYESDLDFALELFDQPMVDRLEWLETKIDAFAQVKNDLSVDIMIELREALDVFY